jgi:hypothetical protein
MRRLSAGGKAEHHDSRAPQSEDLSLHRLWLDRTAGPYGLEQFIVRNQAPCMFNQIRIALSRGGFEAPPTQLEGLPLLPMLMIVGMTSADGPWEC